MHEGDESKLTEVTSEIKSMLPQLVTLNNHQLALGKEKRENRKRHYEERNPGKSGMKESAKKGAAKKEVTKKGTAKKEVMKKEETKKEETKEEKPTSDVEQAPEEMEPQQSGVMDVETKKVKVDSEAVASFLKGAGETELDGWD